MRHVRFPALLFVVMTFVVGVLASSSEAVTVTCTDNGLTYETQCPNPGSGERCINPTGILNGCCNKGTCNGSGNCITGDDQDVNCDDGNGCTADSCAQSNYQVSCVHQAPNPEPTPFARDCNLDNNVCTIDKCNGATCTSMGVTNTCAAEQASNPTSQPICKPWTCDSIAGCDKRAVPNSPTITCDDGKDCTTGDHCTNGVCAKGDSGTVVSGGYPCRDDDTNLGDGVDHRTWCKAGQCNGGEGCSNVSSISNGGACDPNPCTNSHCVGSGASGVCIIDSCNTGSNVYCAPCGTNMTCVNYLAGHDANEANGCGCLSLF